MSEDSPSLADHPRMSEDSASLKAFILGDPPSAALSQCVASVTAALGTSLC